MEKIWRSGEDSVKIRVYWGSELKAKLRGNPSPSVTRVTQPGDDRSRFFSPAGLTAIALFL
jgi:hypothetical protein